MPLNKRNIFNAVVIAGVGAIELATTLYASQYPVPCQIVGAFVGAFAMALRLPVSGNPAPPPEVQS